MAHPHTSATIPERGDDDPWRHNSSSMGSSSNSISSVPSNNNNRLHTRNRHWLVAWTTWTVVALAIVVIAAHQASHDDDEATDTWWRQLVNDNSDSSSSPQQSIHPHHKHPVFNEQHAPLFPLTSSDYWGLVCAVFGLMLAAGGGIGGGGILVPIFCLVMRFSPKHAIPLSNITVLGGALANTMLNARKRHPVADRPLIDWDLILVMQPLMIAGALIGAVLNKVLPELLLTVMLVVLLSVTAYTTLDKAIRMYRAETWAMQKKTGMRSELTRLTREQQEGAADDDDDEEEDADGEQDEEQGTDETKSMGATAAKNDDNDKKEDEQQPESPTCKPEAPASTIIEQLDEDEMLDLMVDDVPLLSSKKQEQMLAHIYEHERHMPATNIRILVILFVVVLTINVSKGGGAFPSPVGITCGSTAFWMANWLMLVWILAVMWHIRNYLLLKYRQKKACGYIYAAGDLVWDERATIIYPLICCTAGLFAGMFGIGGGIVTGPLMLTMGVHPAVGAASSACMILFTALPATTSFVVFGLLVYDYAVVCFFVGFLATTMGQVGLSYLMRRAQRNSYIAFSIGLVVLISAVLLTIQSLLSMAEGEQHHSGGICGREDRLRRGLAVLTEWLQQ